VNIPMKNAMIVGIDVCHSGTYECESIEEDP